VRPKPISKDILRVDILSACSLEERTCPHCGAVRPEIRQKVWEELEKISQKVIVKKFVDA